MATTTLGVKVDEALSRRLKAAAQRLGCTPHALHKQALAVYVDAIERGQFPAEISCTNEVDALVARDAPVIPQTLPPFYEFAQGIQPQSVLRAAITAAYRRPEPQCVPLLISQAGSLDARVGGLATKLVESLRSRRKGGGVEGLVQEFSLSSQEGVALMCLAEALLRIPDYATRDALIRDKIARGDWRSHRGVSDSVFINAATWGLILTGKLITVNSEQTLSRALTRLIAKGGEPLIRQGVNMAMRMMGEQFVAGQTISAAMANGRRLEGKGFRYSYDMLGEAAATADDASRYYASYEQAIHAIGKASNGRGIYEGPGISVKLSALHPRYSRAQRDRVMNELMPLIAALARLARHYDIGLNIDAEEADRLDLSLDLLEALCGDPDLSDWNGIGFVVQAYQKRAPFVIDYLIDLARRSHHRLMLRLVKGAYWDTEIKRTQVEGLEGYPVYTRKVYTDVSYLACARKMLAAPDAVYAQFAIHNAHTLAAIYYMAGPDYYAGQYEFQCLHGMGESLYEDVTGPASQGKLNRPCRIYAPVGTHETLLAYLVRRLLENGANTSFVNQLGDPDIPAGVLTADPILAAADISPAGAPHEKIPLPKDLYGQGAGRVNSAGFDLNNEQRLGSLAAALLSSATTAWRAAPRVGGREFEWNESRAMAVHNPADHRDIVGHVIEASLNDVDDALRIAREAAPIWQATPVQKRAQCLQRASQMLEDEMQPLLGLLVREAGKSFSGAIAEVREAVDFLRFYAAQIEAGFSNDTHRPLGPVICISPWNFPLSIFMGQVAAALAAGNAVLAKPAEQTSLIADVAVGMLQRAGVPAGAVQLLPGDGATVGARLVASPDVRAVLFTGSTEVAHSISTTLAARLDGAGHCIALIAETGGQNAMIVDSSALAEQVVADVLASAFDSAGQRCSALRVLCVQEDCADHVLAMLRGALRELRVGRPDLLATDVGPVIDGQAQAGIRAHIKTMKEAGHPIDEAGLQPDCGHGTFVAPTLIEIDDVSELKKEVFGPVLHIVRYARDQLDDVVDAINATGYGLTFGVHTRIDEIVNRVSARIRAGNLYVNRNIIGAVVGVQPFGGEGLSGTGPKAGGPLYLMRLLSQRPAGLPLPQPSGVDEESSLTLPGPTGESNVYRVKPRGTVLCRAATADGARIQMTACIETGNQILLIDTQAGRAAFAQCDERQQERVKVVPETIIGHGDYQAVLFEGDSDALLQISKAVAARPGPIVPVQGLRPEEIAAGAVYAPEMLVREVSISINTAAAGGNASLMTIA